MKNVWLAVIGLTAIGYGCGPHLAETPYGDKEMEWKGYVNSAYSSWTPPQTIPPVQVGNMPPSGERPDVAPVKETAPQLPPLPALQPLPPLPPLPPVATTPSVPEQTYVVQPNDSFWKIAKKVYNDGDKWPRIKDANLEVLGKKKLQPGMKLRIPAL